MVTVSKLTIEVTDNFDISQSPEAYKKKIREKVKRMGAKNVEVRLEYGGREFVQHTATTIKRHIGEMVEYRTGKTVSTGKVVDCSERNPIPLNDVAVIEIDAEDDEGKPIKKNITILARDVINFIEPCVTN